MPMSTSSSWPRGRFLSETDEIDRQNYCVLGSEAADKLFPFEDPLGKSVQIRSFDFIVIGVLRERMATGGSGGSQAAEEFNKDVYVPLSTSCRAGSARSSPSVRPAAG